MNEENKKKILIGSIIGVVTLVIAVVGATYAFFSLNVSGDTTNTNVDIETGTADVVTIEQGAENIHINLTVSDMAENNPNKEYYATDTEDNYKLSEEEGTLTFATITGTNKEASDCTAKVTITMDTSDDSMGRVLQKGDTILYITSGQTEETVDLYDLLTEEVPNSVTKEIEVELSVSESAEASITGYLKVNNTGSDQSYLAGKTLNITITVDNLVCGVSKRVIALLREDAGESLTKGLVGGMYRYQGTNDVPNWICFGTNDQTKCTDEYDKYMYRIIGVTKEGQLYLLKETPLKEGSHTQFSWNMGNRLDESEVNTCSNGKCPEWNEADLFKRINGTSNGLIDGYGSNSGAISNTDIFVDSIQYDYLKSGDENSGGEASDWYNLIATHSWYYGDTNEAYDGKLYYGDEMYAIETGNSETSHFVISKDSPVISQPYTWENTVDAKINLMYIHDVLYTCLGGNPGNSTNNKDSWMNFQGDTWLASRHPGPEPRYRAWYVDTTHHLNIAETTALSFVHPVFYLDGSIVKLDGKGTRNTPYYITNVE